MGRNPIIMPLFRDLSHPSVEEEKKIQIRPTCAVSKLVLYGREVPWLLQNHDSVQPCTNCCAVCVVLDGTLSADWWSRKTHRRLQFPKEAHLEKGEVLVNFLKLLSHVISL